MAENITPKGIPDVDKLDAVQPIQPETRMPTPQQSFNEVMQQVTPNAPEMQQAGLVSPFDLAGARTPLAQGPTIENLIKQVNASENTINDVRGQLQTPNLRLRQADKYLLNNKLGDARTNFHSAADKVGAPVTPDTKVPLGASPIDRFLSFLSDGATQLSAAKNQLNELNKKGDSVNPSDFLLVQIKMSKAQQSIEFSSIVLAKAMEATTQLMSTQL